MWKMSTGMHLHNTIAVLILAIGKWTRVNTVQYNYLNSLLLFLQYCASLLSIVKVRVKSALRCSIGF